MRCLHELCRLSRQTVKHKVNRGKNIFGHSPGNLETIASLGSKQWHFTNNITHGGSLALVLIKMLNIWGFIVNREHSLEKRHIIYFPNLPRWLYVGWAVMIWQEYVYKVRIRQERFTRCHIWWMFSSGRSVSGSGHQEPGYHSCCPATGPDM